MRLRHRAEVARLVHRLHRVHVPHARRDAILKRRFPDQRGRDRDQLVARRRAAQQDVAVEIGFGVRIPDQVDRRPRLPRPAAPSARPGGNVSVSVTHAGASLALDRERRRPSRPIAPRNSASRPRSSASRRTARSAIGFLRSAAVVSLYDARPSFVARGCQARHGDRPGSSPSLAGGQLHGRRPSRVYVTSGLRRRRRRRDQRHGGAPRRGPAAGLRVRDPDADVGPNRWRGGGGIGRRRRELPAAVSVSWTRATAP